MRISDVTISDLKQYANVYHDEDDNLFVTYLDASKKIISTYTGIPVERNSNVPTVNPISAGSITISGTSTGNTINITLADNTVLTGTVQTGGLWSVTIPVGKTLNSGDKISVTQTLETGHISPASIVTVDVTSSPTPACIDDYEDFVIPLYLLVTEMNDNKSVVVDNEKINFVFKQTLDSHSVNYL